MKIINSLWNSIFLLCVLTHFASAKLLSNVFTKLGSITSTSPSNSPHIKEPYSYWKAQLSWEITESMNANTGDTFQLSMPGVAHVIGSYFDIKLTSGATFASCSTTNTYIYSGTTTVVNCEITLDMSKYVTLSGTLTLPIVFLGGGREYLTTLASRWNVGSNVVTFNGNLKSSVTFVKNTVDATDPFQETSQNKYGDVFYYYLSPKKMCAGQGVKKATFTFTVVTSISGSGIIAQARTERHSSAQDAISPFYFPTAFSSLTIASQGYSNNGRTYTVTWTSMAANRRFWFSTFYSASNDLITKGYSVDTTMTATCQDGTAYKRDTSISFHLVSIDGDSDGSGEGELIKLIFSFSTFILTNFNSRSSHCYQNHYHKWGLFTFY